MHMHGRRKDPEEAPPRVSLRAEFLLSSLSLRPPPALASSLQPAPTPAAPPSLQLDWAGLPGAVSASAPGSSLQLYGLALLGLPYPAAVARQEHLLAAWGHFAALDWDRWDRGWGLDGSSSSGSSTGNSSSEGGSGDGSSSGWAAGADEGLLQPPLLVSHCVLVLPDQEAVWWEAAAAGARSSSGSGSSNAGVSQGLRLAFMLPSWR